MFAARFALLYVPLLIALGWAANSLPAPFPVGAEAVISGAFMVAVALGVRRLFARKAGRPPTSREWARAVVGMLVVDVVAHVALDAAAVGSGDAPVLAVGALALALVGTVALHAAALYGATALLVRAAARTAV